jgi:signal transduction histidine kinase
LNTARFNAACREVEFQFGHGLPGTVSERRTPLWIADVTADEGFVRERGAADAGLHGAIGFPVTVSGEVLGAIEFFSRFVRQPDLQQLDSLAALGTHVGQFVSRARDQQSLEDLAGSLIKAQEDERRRIGRELHDHISQTLGVLTIKIDQLRGDRHVPLAMTAALDELRRDATEITTDVHRLSHRLHSSTLDYLGLVPALQKLAAEFSTRHDIGMDLSHEAVPSALPSEVALCLFRVSEEALNNVAKHSGAHAGRIDLLQQPDGLHLTIHDEGRGFDVARLQQRPGLGLVSMQERLRAVRGTVRIESAPARGTTVCVWVPAASLRTEATGEARPDDRPEPATTV